LIHTIKQKLRRVAVVWGNVGKLRDWNSGEERTHVWKTCWAGRGGERRERRSGGERRCAEKWEVRRGRRRKQGRLTPHLKIYSNVEKLLHTFSDPLFAL